MSVTSCCDRLVSTFSTPENVRQRVTEYYSDTNIDYYRILHANKHLGLHYGYYESEIRSTDRAILNMNRQLATRAAVKKGSRVLDAGCGIGGSSIWLAQNCGAEVSGITLSDQQCELAKENAFERNVENLVDFSVADYCDTSFSSNHFDVVWAIESVCYAEKKYAFVREAARMLKPGGVLIIADGFRMKRDLSQDHEKILVGWLQGWAVEDVDSEEEMRSHFHDCGLLDIQFDDVTENVMPFARHLLRLGLMWSPLTHLLRYSGLIGEVRFQNSQSTVRQYHALKSSVWKYGIMMARKPG